MEYARFRVKNYPDGRLDDGRILNSGSASCKIDELGDSDANAIRKGES